MTPQPGTAGEQLARLTHHRWSVAVLAALHDAGGGSRSAVLAHALAASPAPLRASLEALRNLGLVQANPGYGHPLRPEHVLTAFGRPAARACARLLGWLDTHELASVAARKWTLPVLACMRGEALRFSELVAWLPSISPRALTQCLRMLEAARLVERSVLDGYPPTSRYIASARGRDLARRARRLAGLLAPADAAS